MTIPTTPEAIDRAVEAQRIMQTIAESRGWFSGRYVKEHAVSPDSLRALLEAQPRVWTAETIQDAPDNDTPEYRIGPTTKPGDIKPAWWHPKLLKKEAALELLKSQEDEGFSAVFFGPLPHPPTGNEKGEG